MTTMMLPRHEEFIRERQYLHNVTPATVNWYRHCFRWLPTEEPTQRDLNDAVLRMRESGNKITGCNSVIRCLNTYCHWLTGTDRSCGTGCTHPRLSKLREPRTVLPTFTEQQVKMLVHYKRKRGFLNRPYAYGLPPMLKEGRNPKLGLLPSG